jgi:hypothetical protein
MVDAMTDLLKLRNCWLKKPNRHIKGEVLQG